MQTLVPESPEAIARFRAVRRQLDASLSLMAHELRSRATTLGVLDASRALVETSRALISRAGTPLTHGGVFASHPPSTVEGGEATAASSRTRDERYDCSFPGCTLPTRFQPLFGVQRGKKRILFRNLPVRVCAEHRPALEALLRSEGVREWLRRRFRKLGKDAPDSIRVLFDVVA